MFVSTSVSSRTTVLLCIKSHSSSYKLQRAGVAGSRIGAFVELRADDRKRIVRRETARAMWTTRPAMANSHGSDSGEIMLSLEMVKTLFANFRTVDIALLTG